MSITILPWIALASFMRGPDAPLIDACAAVADVDDDGDVDLFDFADWQNAYECEGASCGRIWREP